jgi:hypothetical protein
MTRPIASASQWAQPYIDEVIEGELLADEPAIDYGRALLLQVGGLAQILAGFALAMTGIGTFPLGLLLVPLGAWLLYRGIRQARDSLRASGTNTGGSAG